jgi:SAM-dependent methyltransferase
MSHLGSDLGRIADYWSAQSTWDEISGIYWSQVPLVKQRLHAKVSGDPHTDWVDYTLQRHLAGRLPLSRCLILGCGRGGLERRLADSRAFAAFDAFDVASGSIAEARDCVRRAGYTNIRYRVQDANQVKLPLGHYDVVWSSGSVHHFERLEHVFVQVARALKPGGLFVLNEYVGPNRFQFPVLQRHIIQACWDLLPPHYREPVPAALTRRVQVASRRQGLIWVIGRAWDKLRDGDLLRAIWRRLMLRLGKVEAGVRFPSARDVAATDPSEAVRSCEIVPLLRRHFQVIEFKPLGGSILQFLLQDIAGNFRDEVGERLLGMLFAIEDALMASGDLASDFVYIVAVPRISPARDEKVQVSA